MGTDIQAKPQQPAKPSQPAPPPQADKNKSTPPPTQNDKGKSTPTPPAQNDKNKSTPPSPPASANNNNASNSNATDDQKKQALQNAKDKLDQQAKDKEGSQIALANQIAQDQKDKADSDKKVSDTNQAVSDKAKQDYSQNVNNLKNNPNVQKIDKNGNLSKLSSDISNTDSKQNTDNKNALEDLQNQLQNDPGKNSPEIQNDLNTVKTALSKLDTVQQIKDNTYKSKSDDFPVTVNGQPVNQKDYDDAKKKSDDLNTKIPQELDQHATGEGNLNYMRATLDKLRDPNTTADSLLANQQNVQSDLINAQDRVAAAQNGHGDYNAALKNLRTAQDAVNIASRASDAVQNELNTVTGNTTPVLDTGVLSVGISPDNNHVNTFRRDAGNPNATVYTTLDRGETVDQAVRALVDSPEPVTQGPNQNDQNSTSGPTEAQIQKLEKMILDENGLTGSDPTDRNTLGRGSALNVTAAFDPNTHQMLPFSTLA